MLAITLQILPFFALIFCGYLARRVNFVSADAAQSMTQFVFYFALSAMLLRFCARLEIEALFDLPFALAYVIGTGGVYLIGLGAGMIRRQGLDIAAIEAHSMAIGNNGFLAIPMLLSILGAKALGPVLMVLVLDLAIFGALVVVLITGARAGRIGFETLRRVLLGLARNPMLISMGLGLMLSLLHWQLPKPVDTFLEVLGAAATPCALFVIGCSLAGKSPERIGTALWLSFGKLILHPALIALCAFVLFPVEPYAAGIMLATAAMPTAGNVYILAQHYGTAPQRVSTTILITTVLSILTLSYVLAKVG